MSRFYHTVMDLFGAKMEVESDPFIVRFEIDGCGCTLNYEQVRRLRDALSAWLKETA